jgi:hypothetical protein
MRRYGQILHCSCFSMSFSIYDTDFTKL